MATLPSGGFKPVQPDGFVISASSREAPKIEITGTDPLCQPPLPLSSCDVALCGRDDFHHHGDVGGAMDPFVDEPHSLSQQHDPCDSRRGFRRSEGGPGKCPSPSRNSPRRHSPVPYSPKRQHHSRTSASSVTSDEFPDVTFSPRRHSPVPLLHEERPCSLPLTSSTPEEFICVSYSDPFTSPTITHTSEAFLAISIDCVQGVGSDDDDVEMTSQDLPEMTSDDHQGDPDHDTVLDDVVAGCADSKQTSSDPRTSSGDASSEEDNAVVHCNRSAPESSSVCKTSSADDDKNEVLCDREIQEGDRTTSPAVGESKSVSGFHNVTMCGESESVNLEQQVLANTEPCSNKIGASDNATFEAESVDSEECFHDAAFSSDSSSEDEDMEEMLLAAQPSSVSCFTSSLLHRNHSENIIPQENAQSFVSVTTPVDSVNTHAEEDSSDMTANSAWTDGSQNTSEEQDSTGDTHSLSVFTNSNAAWRRASFPFQHQGWGSLPPCPQWDGERRRNTEGGRTPEDFSLPRVVGHPPLHFPHGHGVVLVHCALPSPYDPHLPTPPIVLTPHTSYTDLHVAVDGRGQGAPEGSSKRPDIARSRSFPNLDQEQGGRFPEPHQTWPELGESASAAHHDDHMVDGDCDHSGMDAENSCDSRQQGIRGSTELTKAETSPSLPGSAALNGRAAVIGRLRRVVERRLSSSAEAGP